jgi:hypothetical protein
MGYSCHICGETRHKIIDCPKFNAMQNMFKNKGMKTIEKPFMVEPKVINPSIHVVNVNMAIIGSKITKEQVFKDKSKSRRSLLLIGKKSRDYINLLSRLYKRCK